MGNRTCCSPSAQTKALFGRYAFLPWRYESLLAVGTVVNIIGAVCTVWLGGRLQVDPSKIWPSQLVVPIFSALLITCNLILYFKDIRRPAVFNGLHPKYTVITCLLQIHAWTAQCTVDIVGTIATSCYGKTPVDHSVWDYWIISVPKIFTTVIMLWVLLRYLCISVSAYVLLTYGPRTRDHEQVSIELSTPPREQEATGSSRSPDQGTSSQVTTSDAQAFERTGRTADSNLSFLA